MKCKPWIRHFQPPKFKCLSSQCALHGLRALQKGVPGPSRPGVSRKCPPKVPNDPQNTTFKGKMAACLLGIRSWSRGVQRTRLIPSWSCLVFELKSQKDYKINVRGLFRHCFDTPGGEAGEVLFETFGDFGARGGGDSCIWGLQS